MVPHGKPKGSAEHLENVDVLLAGFEGKEEMEVKQELEAIMDNPDKTTLFESILRESDAKVGKLAIDLVWEQKKNRAGTLLLSQAVENNNRDVRRYALLMFSRFDQQAIQGVLSEEFIKKKPRLAEAIAIALPLNYPFPPGIAEQLLSMHDATPELVNNMAQRVPEVAWSFLHKVKREKVDQQILDSGEETIDIVVREQLINLRNKEIANHKRNIVEKILQRVFPLKDGHTQEKIAKFRKLLMNMGDGGMTPDLLVDLASIDAPRTKDSWMKKILKEERLETLKISSEEFDEFLAGLAGIGSKAAFREERESITAHQILMSMINYKDGKYYIELLSAKTPAEKRAVLMKVLFLEELMKDKKGKPPVTKVLLDHFIRKKKVIDIAIFKAAKTTGKVALNAAKAAVGIAPAALLTKAALSTVEPATPNTTGKEIEQDFVPAIADKDLQSVINTNRETLTVESDGSVSVVIGNGQEQIKVHMKIDSNKNREMYILAKDGTKIAVTQMTIDGVEEAGTFKKPLYETGKQWDTSGRGKQILDQLHNIDLSDGKLSNKADIERYRDFVIKALPTQEKEMLKLFRNLGVLNSNYMVNGNRSKRVRLLFDYLELHMGLENISQKQLETIATVWEQSGKQKLLTPAEAEIWLKDNAENPDD